MSNKKKFFSYSQTYSKLKSKKFAFKCKLKKKTKLQTFTLLWIKLLKKKWKPKIGCWEQNEMNKKKFDDSSICNVKNSAKKKFITRLSFFIVNQKNKNI